MTTTNVMMSSAPTGSTGQEETRPDFASASRTIRFGVAFRLLIAFAAITAFAALTSAIALYTFGKYGDGFNRIASSSLPALVAASDLAQRSQALAANAPNLAVADGHFGRRAISEALQNQMQAITDAGKQIMTLAPSTEGLDSLTRNETLLNDNIQKLDGLVAEKLEADRVAANFMLRLRTLSVRVRTADSDLLSKLVGEQNAQSQTDALSAWTAAADEAIVILLSTASADTKIRLNRLRAEFTEAANRAQAARAQFEPLLAGAINPLEEALAQYGHGSPNVFDVRTAQLTSTSAVRGALLDTKDASAQFVGSAEHVFADVQKDARAQSEYFRERISEYSRLFTVLSLLCIGGACAVFLYINRSIIQRLRNLSQSMRASVFGRTTPITISGNDEISDMARAAEFFVTSLAHREKGLRESVEELRALGEVIQAVNSSVDLETVLTTIVAKATQLSGTEAGAIYVFDDVRQEFRLRATYGLPDSIVAELRDSRIRLGQTAISEAVKRRAPIQIADVLDDPSVTLDVIVRAGFRALLVVPLLGADRIVGAFVVRRKQPGEFHKNTVDLLQTFAAQSVLAIQNARLFESVEARTRELAKSLEDLRTAQDRLVQTEKLASLGQLTAGIAHEIKNPLNFVNNFSAISVELIDELRQALAGANLGNKLRAEISKIADTLQGNLDKVVQYGKRADSIVKNMLLHSQQGSQEHRPVDINAIVEDSLNLAYHGARAEKQGFNITLERSFDPAAGEVDVFPQDITRVLLNLISNGFYAATKRKAETNGGDYEPILAAVTKNLGDSVEIRIRDNGTGIPHEMKAKIFNPFFTTKPPGEGTGLGLSISHDIIVKQHGGSIEVDTQPGEFTEFRIVLPRTGASLIKSGEPASH
jgi:signal transduction histidine kinase